MNNFNFFVDKNNVNHIFLNKALKSLCGNFILIEVTMQKIELNSNNVCKECIHKIKEYERNFNPSQQENKDK